jgi:hypothetical protein
MSRQLPLPGFETPRQVCLACKRPAALLGQWSPGNSAYLCRDCSLGMPAPMHIFEYGYKGRAVTIRRDLTRDDDKALMQRVSAEDVLRRLKSGCAYTLEALRFSDTDGDFELPCEARDYEPHPDCRACRRRHRGVLELARYACISPSQAQETINNGVRDQARHGRARLDARIENSSRQQMLPLCKRCGCGHDNRNTGLGDLIREYCQRCEAEMGVDGGASLMLMLHGDDDEAVLDRFYKSFPEWFASGVLPDYWYELKRRRMETR